MGQDRAGSVGKYFPYGEERNNPQLPNDIVKFATYTRDSATGLDYAMNRYYNSGMGRFASPDPSRSSESLTDPGQWNRYSYVVARESGREPYGEERNNPQTSNDAVKFASYTRDSATGLDYADQRYFASGLGRFTSADPHRTGGGSGNSQGWNSYTYVENDPINFNDPAGLDMCYIGVSVWMPSGGGAIVTTPLFAPCGLSTLDAMIYTSWAAYFALQMNDVHSRTTPVSARQIAAMGAELAKKWLKGVLSARLRKAA